MNIEKLTVKQICNCIALINKMTEEKLIKFNPNKACVQFNYDKVTKYLEEQNIKQQKQLEAYENMRKEAIEYAKNSIDLLKPPSVSTINEEEYAPYIIIHDNYLNILNKVGGSDE